MRRPTHIVASDVDLGAAKELVTLRAGLDDFAEDQIHPVVACDEVAVEGLAILKLDQHRVALCGREEAKRKLIRTKISWPLVYIRRIA